MSAKKRGGSSKKTNPEVFDVRDVVLAKVRGYPQWPAMVVDPEAVPQGISRERPKNTKTAVYCVRYFPQGDYSWLGAKELERLTEKEINAFVNDQSKKEGDLKEGYKTALDPTAWEAEHAANPPAQKKRKGRSKGKKDDDEEEEEEQDELVEEEEEEKTKVGKKRKRAASPAPKKKAGAAAAAGKKGAAGKTKKSKPAVESEDDGEDEVEAEAEKPQSEGKRASKKAKVVAAVGGDDANALLESDPEALKVREWRHKLQKTFLSSNKAPPKADEMPNIDALFTTIETYEGFTIAYLTFSKIGKVMRHINLLEPARVPRDDEFHFRDRAKALVDRWQDVLAASKAADGVTEGTAKMDINGAGEGEAEAEAGGEGDLTMME
ncbi:PWWP domain-containing protein [Favolaschia claudopus]|uniref:PWWP domain-containing protein n=1 Tax=Favolaschia claudopus TaxID=2862362 RepID=A0AAW0DFH2_9AGAR